MISLHDGKTVSEKIVSSNKENKVSKNEKVLYNESTVTRNWNFTQVPKMPLETDLLERFNDDGTYGASHNPSWVYVNEAKQTTIQSLCLRAMMGKQNVPHIVYAELIGW